MVGMVVHRYDAATDVEDVDEIDELDAMGVPESNPLQKMVIEMEGEKTGEIAAAVAGVADLTEVAAEEEPGMKVEPDSEPDLDPGLEADPETDPTK
ncbi:hypothetical protein EC991_007285 [Linnemannia zychae]|nr:hypothetical protein EC991_007285 [Linnemannia zychae]